MTTFIIVIRTEEVKAVFGEVLGKEKSIPEKRNNQSVSSLMFTCATQKHKKKQKQGILNQTAKRIRIYIYGKVRRKALWTMAINDRRTRREGAY